MLTTKEERKHIKKAITILFIFATENTRIIVIIQKANANLIAFFSIDQPFTYAMLVRMRSSFDVNSGKALIFIVANLKRIPLTKST